jgi:Flp pilus assembly protein TadD
MEMVLTIDPDNAEALNFIGYSYADRGMNLEEAEKMITKALKIKPDNGYLIDSLGWVNFKKNKLSSAVKYLKQALELLPDDINIIEHMGDVYVKLNKTKEAQEMYNRALKLDPKNSSVQKKLEDLTRQK